jgi:hypothetical protein
MWLPALEWPPAKAGQAPLVLLPVYHIALHPPQNAQFGWGDTAFAFPVKAADATPAVATPAPTSNPPRSTPRLVIPSVTRRSSCVAIRIVHPFALAPFRPRRPVLLGSP